MGDSGRTTTYQGDPFVWKIDHGGETAWYVATYASDAMKEHELLAAEQSDGPFTITLVPPETPITIHASHDESDTYPDSWREDDEDRSIDERNVTAFAAEFAEFHANELMMRSNDALQLCTTEY